MRLAAVFGAWVSLALAGCGSESARELPPPAGPPGSPALTTAPAGRVMPLRAAHAPRDSALARTAAQAGRVAQLEHAVAVLSTRSRVLEIRHAGARRVVAEAPAGVGPTHVACLPRGPCLVTDTRGQALLRFVLRPHLELVRSLYLPGGPYGIAVDAVRDRLWITLPGLNQLVELPARANPHVLRRFPTVRQPRGVAVDGRTGSVLVIGHGVLEWIDPDR